MFSNELISEIATELADTGRSLVRDGEGKRLLLVSSRRLDLPGHDLILAYEGQGTIFFSGDRPMNYFRLLASGFREEAARSISDMVNRLVPRIAAPMQRIEAAKSALPKEAE